MRMRSIIIGLAWCGSWMGIEWRVQPKSHDTICDNQIRKWHTSIWRHGVCDQLKLNEKTQRKETGKKTYFTCERKRDDVRARDLQTVNANGDKYERKNRRTHAHKHCNVPEQPQQPNRLCVCVCAIQAGAKYISNDSSMHFILILNSTNHCV